MSAVVINIDTSLTDVPTIEVGKQGENGATQVVFDVSEMVETYGSGTAYVVVQRRGDAEPYLLDNTSQSGNKVTWTVSNVDTDVYGTGRVQLFWMINEQVAKTVTYQFYVEEALHDPQDAPVVPGGWISDEIGNLDNLTTTAKANLVAAINEVNSKATTNATAIGTLANLTTTEKSNLVGAINEVNEDVSGLKEDFDEIRSITTNTQISWASVTLTVQGGYYVNSNGNYVSDTSRACAVVNVAEGERYKLSTYIGSVVISGIVFFKSDNTVLSHLLDGTGTGQTITDYEFIVPANASWMAVQAADYRHPPTLTKYNRTIEFVGYTKSEINESLAEINNEIDDITGKKYGLRWDVSNAEDIGERCFDAVGLTASIGIGTTDGASDFDDIYPWSEIKRCNIKSDANGASIITFEGETGFALDGTNGDVFVRVPVFYCDRYRNNGYEYIIISKDGTNIHPAFVENGKKLKEIFIGAFEGYINNGELKSVSGVIPSNNDIPQTFLSSAQTKGKNYTLYDMRAVDAIWSLMVVEFGKRNTNRILGYGFADYFQAVGSQYGVLSAVSESNTNVFKATTASPGALAGMPVGSNILICKGNQVNILTQAKLLSVDNDGTYYKFTFDGNPVDIDTTCFIGSAPCTTNFCESVPSGALSWHTGRTNWVANSDTKNPVRYRWIENVVGSLWHFLPDITFDNLQMYQCLNMEQYVMGNTDDGYNPVGSLFTQQSDNGSKADVADANYWVDDLFDDYFTEGVAFGKSWDKTLTSQKAFGAYYYLNNGKNIIANGGGFDHLYRCNMLTQRAQIVLNSQWYLYGARLMYKHLA